MKTNHINQNNKNEQENYSTTTAGKDYTSINGNQHKQDEKPGNGLNQSDKKGKTGRKPYHSTGYQGL